MSRSLDYAVSLPESYSALSKVWLAAVRLNEGDLLTAQELIRETPENVSKVSRNLALAYAADIYLEAGIMDTAYMYAHELVTNEDMTNKKTGYRILTSPEFRQWLHPDTLSRYYADYKRVLEDYFNDNRNELALLQKSRYDYSLHERESRKAHKDKERMRWIAAGFAFLVVILAFAVLYVKYRGKSSMVRLHEALDSLEVLRRQLALPADAEAGLVDTGQANVTGGHTVSDYVDEQDLELLRQQASVEDMEGEAVNFYVENRTLYVEPAGHISLSVFDICGRQIFNGDIEQPRSVPLGTICSPMIIVNCTDTRQSVTKKLLVK